MKIVVKMGRLHAVPLVSIATSIQALSEEVDRVKDRQALKAASLDVSGDNAHATNPTDEVEFMSLSSQNYQLQQYGVEELAETRIISFHHDYEHQNRKPNRVAINPLLWKVIGVMN